MRYADYLKRSMGRLTPDAWGRQLTADPSARPAPKTVLTACPCRGVPVVVGLIVTLLRGPADPDPATESCDTHADLTLA